MTDIIKAKRLRDLRDLLRASASAARHRNHELEDGDLEQVLRSVRALSREARTGLTLLEIEALYRRADRLYSYHFPCGPAAL